MANVVFGEMTKPGHLEQSRVHDNTSARGALEKLFESSFDDLYRYCLARTANRSAAEEAASEAFLAAARTFASGRGASVDRAWLFVVARNRIVDGWRSRERHRRRIERLASVRQKMDSESEDTDRRGQAVVEVLRTLPERQRAALALRYLDDCSVGDVAAELDIEYSAAESLLARGRRGFTRAWKDCHG